MRRSFNSVFISRYKLIAFLVVGLQMIVMLPLDLTGDYASMACVSVCQLVFLILLINCGKNDCSLMVLFLVLNWMFHCGHIVCVGFDLEATLNLDFRQHGSDQAAFDSFRFYFMAQSLICLSAILFSGGKAAGSGGSGGVFQRFVSRETAASLVAVGILPRLYVDVSRLAGAFSSGYEGVYGLTIAAPVQALAFFFDAGIVMAMVLLGKSRKETALFYAIVLMKVVLMGTGARQEALCFLIMAAYLHFIVIRKMTVTKIVPMVVGGIGVLLAVDVVGEFRSQGLSFAAVLGYLGGVSLDSVAVNMLGEFGAAFTTLATVVQDVPDMMDYGYGKSFVAGILSVVPTLVSRFPGLSESAYFVTALPVDTAFFGGSFLAEFYYNFSWFGLIACVPVGAVLAYCQRGLSRRSYEKQGRASAWWAALVFVFMLLYIRGYFIDCVMKLAYVMVFVWIVYHIYQHFGRKGYECGGVRLTESRAAHD